MAAVLRKPVSIVYSGAGWYLTPHKGLVKFSSFCLPRKPQVALDCAGKTDPSTDRQVGKENVTVFPHVQKQSARRYSESCNVLKGGNLGGIETKNPCVAIRQAWQHGTTKCPTTPHFSAACFMSCRGSKRMQENTAGSSCFHISETVGYWEITRGLWVQQWRGRHCSGLEVKPPFKLGRGSAC